MLLVLDIDATLIYSCSQPFRKGLWSDFSVCGFEVYKRPYLDGFLSAVSPKVKLAVWSAGTMDYVSLICAEIFKDYKLEFVFDRAKCKPRLLGRNGDDFDDFAFTKDMKKVKAKGFDLAEVVIVDDTPKAIPNYGNVIPIRSWDGNPDDTELEKLAKYIPKLIGKDVRKIDKRNWRN